MTHPPPTSTPRRGRAAVGDIGRFRELGRVV